STIIVKVKGYTCYPFTFKVKNKKKYFFLLYLGGIHGVMSKLIIVRKWNLIVKGNYKYGEFKNKCSNSR
uniref:hypothetical protein n=1 Tax=Hathewaya massiliensis TaxID=1964382 RepID=UPI001A9B14AE